MTSDKLNGIEMNIEISEDRFEARLSLTYIDDSVQISFDELMEKLNECGVVYGVKEKLVAEICSNRNTVCNITVATGKEPQQGEDARIEYFYKKKRKPCPKALDNGAVDFKELGYIEMVSAGDILAQKTIATEGEDGVTVFGDIVKAHPGKDKHLLCGEGCYRTEDELRVIAEYNGVVKVKDNKLTVDKYIEINKDVGVETGNIRFCGHVIVNGNVTDGYEVDCDGDLLIKGFAEGAVLKSTGNIIVSKGIHGQWKALIQCDGDLTTTYINGASVNVKGNIDADYILNSKIQCEGEIYAHGKKGIIVGGEIVAKSIIAEIVGSDLGVATIVRLGVSVGMLNTYRVLNDEVDVLMDMVSKLKQCLFLLGKRVENNSEDTKSMDMIAEYSQKLDKLIQALNSKEEELLALQSEIVSKTGDLKAALIHSDTHVYFGSRKIVVKDDLAHCIVTKDQDEIKIMECN